MWLRIIIIAVIIGGIIGLFCSRNGKSAGENALGGAMAYQYYQAKNNVWMVTLGALALLF